MCGGPVLSTVASIAGSLAGGPVGTAIQVASAAKGISDASKAQKETKKANATAASNAQKSLALQEQEINKANAKSPNLAGLIEANRQDTLGATSLTGPTGVKKSELQLGKNTLLGK